MSVLTFEQVSAETHEAVQRSNRLARLASWVVEGFRLPEVDHTPATRHDFTNQASQVPTFMGRSREQVEYFANHELPFAD